MSRIVTKILLLLLAVSFLTVPIAGAETHGTTVQFSTDGPVNEIIIDATQAVKDSGGYTVNGEKNVKRILPGNDGGTYRIAPIILPKYTSLKVTVTYYGISQTTYHDDYVDVLFPANPSQPLSVRVELDLHYYGTDNPPAKPNVPVIPENPSDPNTPVNPENPDGPDTPGNPDTPDVPDTPGNPDTPDVPDTPSVPSSPGVPGKPTVVPSTPSDPEHPDTPGSDEPLVPILPPADSVYNFAGFIPLLAGFLLLFLLVAFRGNLVYRILKKHAKRHGEKPDKEEKKQLKATASAIILLIRDEERYGEWKKNREMAKRLSADIVSVLDEMNYARAVPRGALVAEILKAARGRINRHRL